MDEKVLSVILPNYNHGRYLEDAVVAIAGQDRPPDEIIVIDDASTDDSLAILRGLQAHYTCLQILVNETNQGAILTLERGLHRARGRYVYFAAADDRVLPGFFSMALGMLEAAPDVGLFCAETILADGLSGRRIGIRPAVRPIARRGRLSPAGVEALLRRADHFIHTGSSVLRRTTVIAKGGFDSEAGSFADGLLCRKIALEGGLCFAPEPVSVWQVHADSQSMRTALDRAEARKALVEMPRRIAQDPDFPPWYAEAFERRWRFAVMRLNLQQRSPDRVGLREMMPDTGLDRFVLGLALPWITLRTIRVALLAWLTMRLKPFRLRDVVKTALSRHGRYGAAKPGHQ